MIIEQILLHKTRLKAGLPMFYLIMVLMTGILVVKMIPALSIVFPPPFYLTLHSIVEFLGVSISTAVFIVAWYNFQHTKRLYELIVCLTFLVIAIFSFAHALSYKGMPDFFTGNSVNKASTYWILTRLSRAVGLFTAVMVKPKMLENSRWKPVVALMATITATSYALVAVAMNQEFLPHMYVPELGQTALKVGLEYVGISFEIVALIYLLTQKAKQPDERFIEAALLFLIFSSVAFTMYSNAYDTYNLIGHIYMVAAFILILRGLFVGSVVRLYEANKVLEEQRFKLAEVNTRLEELSQLKSEFLAITNHELRTPLTSIIGFTEMLLDKETGPLNEIQKDYLLEINDSGHRLLVDINNLLDLSKMEAGKMRLHTDTIFIDGLISDVLRQFKPIFRQKHQSVTVIVQADLPKVTIDVDKIKKVLVNLLSNAHKFSPEGGTISLAVKLSADARFLVVSVADEGIGLSAADAKYIFDTFYQVEESSTRHYQGTGLGLTLVKHVIELHGGTVSIESEPGQGSTFSFTLPLNLPKEEVM